MRLSYLLWAMVVIAGGVSLFLIKYKVQALENELIAQQQQVIRDRAAIRVLQAEWTHLNDPERLRRLSAEHLGFGPPSANNVAEIAGLPFRHENVPGQAVSPTALPVLPAPQTHTELTTQRIASSPQNPNVGRVFVARLQRLLFPSAIGATTQKEGAR